jgi:hypothetical protein
MIIITLITNNTLINNVRLELDFFLFDSSCYLGLLFLNVFVLRVRLS